MTVGRQVFFTGCWRSPVMLNRKAVETGVDEREVGIQQVEERQIRG